MRKLRFTVYLCFFISFSAVSQNYDNFQSIARDPSYILDEYYEIIKNDSGQSEILHYTKYFLLGSTSEKWEYALGTPYFQDQEWHSGLVKLPGQQEVKGFLSYNQVYQRVYFKPSAVSQQRILVEPEYFIIDGTTFNSFSDIDIMNFAYFKSISIDGYNILSDNRKIQANDINLEILDPYNISDKQYTAEFKDQPSFFIFKNKEAIKIEDKNYFYRQFGSKKKAQKSYKEQMNINFSNIEDVVLLLKHLSNQ